MGHMGKAKGDKGKGRKGKRGIRLAVETTGGVPDPVFVAQRLTSLTLHLLRRLAREEQVTGIRPARLSALATLAADGPTTLGGLARRERVTPPSMTRLVQALESGKLAKSLLTPEQVKLLRAYPNEKLRTRFQKVLE